MLVTVIPAIAAGVALGEAEGAAWALIIHQLVLQVPHYAFFLRALADLPLLGYVATVGQPIIYAALMAGVVALVGILLDETAQGLEALTQVSVGAAAYGLILATVGRRDVALLWTAVRSR
jgi:hypothetical protein